MKYNETVGTSAITLEFKNDLFGAVRQWQKNKAISDAKVAQYIGITLKEYWDLCKSK